jgi:hypothetical protein
MTHALIDMSLKFYIIYLFISSSLCCFLAQMIEEDEQS